MNKQELIHLHNLLYRTTEYIEDKENIEIDRTEYREHDVGPNTIQARKRDQEKAIDLILKTLNQIPQEEDKFGLLEKEQLEEDVNTATYGGIELHALSDREIIEFKQEDVNFQIHNRGRKHRYDVLEDLADGETLEEAVDEIYSTETKHVLKKEDYREIQEVTQNGVMPEEYRNNLQELLEDRNKLV